MMVEEQEIEAEGLPTRYLMAGEGPPLLLLHGAGVNALDWQWVLPDLARTHRVYAPDLPGSGGSAKPAADYSPASFTRFVAAFMDALGVECVVVVGNFLGGRSPTPCDLWPCPATASWRSLGARGLLGPSRGPWEEPYLRFPSFAPGELVEVVEGVSSDVRYVAVDPDASGQEVWDAEQFAAYLAGSSDFGS